MKNTMFALLLATAAFARADGPTLSPHWINAGLNNRDLTISPDGTELFSTVMAPGNHFAAIVTSRKINGHWQPPELAPFSGQYSDIEPMFAPDGKRLYFASKRPKPDRKGSDWDIWYVQRVENGQWSPPVNAGAPINTEGNEFYPSVGASGNLYFTAEREQGEGHEDIFRAVMKDGRWTRIESVGPGVNTRGNEFNAFVAADETFIIFSSQGTRDHEVGGGDLYISRRGEGGEFMPATLLPGNINSSSLEYCPFVHADRLYFTSRRVTNTPPFENYDEMTRAMTSPGNGAGNIYSVVFDAASAY